ncbi:RmlC-like cupin domain-containing protein [Xylariaceae sp. FL0804]|nr:RmlC-like cupin domain-containing protein [Xylariaceae sp. FL0804]
MRPSLHLSAAAAAVALSLKAGCAAAAALESNRNSNSSQGNGAASSRSMDERSAQAVIAQLQLVANDEKGYYVQTFEDSYRVSGHGGPAAEYGNRSASTAIYYLLEGGEGDSVWHRVDAVETWHHYAGAPLTLSLSFDDGAPLAEVLLGPDVFAGQRPQYPIPCRQWQSARSHGDWTLVGTTVAPGFIASGVELAPTGWQPNTG